MATHRKLQPCIVSVPRDCWIPMWTGVQLRMIATHTMRQGQALVQLSSMPEMASMSSIATSCSGMWPQAFENFGLDINYSRGQRYLGGFIGSAEKKEEWLPGMVEKWAAAMVTLSTVTERYHQTAYAGFIFCMQNELQYVQ